MTMMPNFEVLLLSTTGSAMFFSAGFSAGRLLPRRGAKAAAEAEQAARAALEQQVSELKAKLAATHQQRREAEAANEAERQRADVESQRADAEEERAEVERQRADAAADQTQAAWEETERCKAELEQAEQETQALRAELATARRSPRPPPVTPPPKPAMQRAAADKQVEQATQEAKRVRQELANERSRHEAESRKLKGELTALTQQLKSHNAEISRLKGQLDEWYEEPTQVRRDMGTTLSELARVQQELAATKAKLQAERQAAARPQESREREEKQKQGPAPNADDLARALEQLAQVKKQLDEVTSEKEDLEVRQEASVGYVRRAQQEAKRCAATLETAEQQHAAQLADLTGRLKRVEAQAATAERLEEENRALRSQVGEQSTPEPAQLEAVVKAHKQLQIEAAKAQTRVRELESEAVEVTELRRRTKELERDAAEIPRLQKQVAQLEAQLTALGRISEPPVSPASVRIDPKAYPVAAATQDTLRSLLESKQIRVAVLADNHGLPIESEGDPSLESPLAAVTGVMASLAGMASGLLPLARVHEVGFKDLNQAVVSCRLFDCQGDAMALATLGMAAPPPSVVDRVVAHLIQTLASPGSKAQEE